jgi:quercetin dioxygenase-like cupin family protein
MADLDIELTFDEFQEWALGQGADEVLVRKWESNREVGNHEHPFSVRAHVAQGEMWLSIEGVTRHLTQGDAFELNSHVWHSEKYGPEGATFWAARFN